MQKFYTALLLILFVSVSYAQSYHTIAIDGNNDFNATTEKFTTTGPENLFGYVTFDREYVYIGFSGDTPWGGGVTANTRNYHIYIDSDPMAAAASGTGTTQGESGTRFTPTLPFSANFHYRFSTDQNTELRRVYNGSWQDGTFSTSNWKGNGYWELKLKISDFTANGQLNIVAYVEENSNTGTMCGGVPANAFVNTNIGGNVTVSHWLNLNVMDQVTPTLTYNNSNYQWAVRLTARAGSLVDSTAYAGMALNAQNVYDAGVDLPKPPTPPSSYLEVFFPHANWTTALGPNFMRDFRALVSLDSTTNAWDFTVRTDQTNASVTLTADQFSNVPSNYGILIQDVASDSLHNVRLNGSYTFNSGQGGDKLFRLVIGVTFASPNISLSSSTLDYGSIKIGRDSTKSVVITNTGDSTLVISNINSTNAAFALLGNTTYTLGKQQSATVSVKFTPVLATQYTGKLQIRSNDPDAALVEVALSGAGQQLFPIISTSTNALVFGSIGVSYDSTITFKVFNTGDTTLTVSSGTFTGTVFSLRSAFPVTILKSDSAVISVKFSPLAMNNYQDTLTLVNNDPDRANVKIALSGSGNAITLTNNYPAGWNLSSVPLTQTNASTASVIGDDIASFVLYKYSNGAYTNSDSVQAGNGYWLGIESAATVDVSGVPTMSNSSKLLRGGWNLSASPFNKAYPKSAVKYSKNGITVSSDSAVALQWIQNQYYGYSRSDSAYHTSNSLSPWSGYWFAALSDSVTAVFEYTTAAGRGAVAPENPSVDVNNWFVNILAQANNRKDNFLSFGVATDASAGFDSKFDLAKPPVSPEGAVVRTSFKRLDWSPYFDNYATDIKAPLSSSSAQTTWSFTVQTNTNTSVTLSWRDIIAQVPESIRNDYKFSLSGPGITGQLDMENILSYTFIANAGIANLFTVSSVLTAVNPGIEKAFSFALEQNYPNPFNPSTIIGYQVAQSGKVMLTVYDVLGNEVRTLVNDYKVAGNYQVHFNATGLASGTYFYKLLQGESVQVKKFIYLK